jgi:RNA polymerase sigma-70 factor (ECF subfamily)
VPEDEDAILVARVGQGDLVAFEALYNKYKTMVFRTAYAITRERFAAEEITQECFIRAYRSMPTVDASDSLGPWLHRIAANLSYNWWKAARRQWLFPLEQAAEAPAPSLASPPAQVAQQDELRRAIMDALESLGFQQRVALILFYLGGFSIEEIAYILDCPVGTVKSRLYYGRSKLRRKLSRMRQAPEVAFEF